MRAMAAAAAIVLSVAAAWMLLAGRPAHPNLLLITIDTLRADRVGAYGYRRAVTPVLDGLAARGVRFDRAQAAVPLTGPSHATILTGRYPPVHGVRDNVVFTLAATQPTIATLLKKQRYRTAAFVAAYPVAAAFGFGQGFDQFDEGFSQSPAAGHGVERPGNEVADAAIRWLSPSHTEPFFLWLHFYDPHAPYAPPAPYGETFRTRPYDGEIAFTDAQVGRVLEALRAAGREKDTVVLVVGDHGEALGDHGEATHAVLIYQSTLRVPLILAGPGVSQGRVVLSRVGTIDIAPTLLGLLGFGPAEGMSGRDLRPALDGHPIADESLYAESLFGRLNCRWSSLRGLIRGDWKLIEGVEPELYNLADDPEELHNRAKDQSDRLRPLRQELRAALQTMAPAGDVARANAMSPEQEQRLRSLGYTAGSGGVGALDARGLPDPRTHVQFYDRVQAATTAQGPFLTRAFQDVAAIAELDPGNPFVYGTLAALAYRGGSLPVAARAFSRALELDPDRPAVRQNYGKLLREIGRLDESEQQLRIAVSQTTPDDARTRISLAETLTDLGKTAEAEAIINQILEKEPQHAEALGAKGRLLVSAGRAKEAVEYLEKATALSDPESWIELASVDLSLGDTTKAHEAVSRALRQSPGHPWALAVAGHALILEGRRAEGLDLLKRAMAAPPRRPGAWLSLAAAYEAAGDKAAAAACRREAAAARG